MKTREEARIVLVCREATISQAIETFIHLGLVGRSQKTREWYRKRLSYFADWIGGEMAAGVVEEVDLLGWAAAMEEQKTRWGGESTHPETSGGYSAYYRHSMIRSVKFFFRWLAANQVTSSNPAEHLVLPRLPKTGRKGIADSDAEKILDLARTHGIPLMRGFDDDQRERDYALLSFLESTGARLGGIVNLKLEDLRLEKRQATVREKGTKERTVFMSEETAAAIASWLAVRPDLPDDHVFLGRKCGAAWRTISENGIHGIVKRYALAAGVRKNWSPHQWRHRFGRRLAQKGVSLGTIAQIMGHEDVSVTVRHYGIFAVAELQDIYDKVW